MRRTPLKDWLPLGDRGWLARFDDEASAALWCEGVRALAEPGVVDVVPAYRTVAVLADPDLADLDALESRLRSIRPRKGSRLESRLQTIPVLYDGEDLAEVASQVAMSVEQVVEMHSRSTYQVFAIGFQPGFPYAGYLDPAFNAIQRRSRPRLKVPAGSVAIAARQTGIYPTELPGGWNLLGRTPLTIVDLSDAYFPIRPGDRIRFVPIDIDEFESLKARRL